MSMLGVMSGRMTSTCVGMPPVKLSLSLPCERLPLGSG